MGCKTMLLENHVLLDELTEMLVEKETVDYQEMQALVTKYYPDGVNQKLKLPAEAALLSASLAVRRHVYVRPSSVRAGRQCGLCVNVCWEPGGGRISSNDTLGMVHPLRG